MTWARITDEFPGIVAYYDLSPNAITLHLLGIQSALSAHQDGLISVLTATQLMQSKNMRKRAEVIDELVRAGLWAWVNDEHLQIDWDGQETADQAAEKRKARNKKQGDYVTRNLKCAAGDHSMCEGTSRRCQTTVKKVSDRTHTTPPHTTPQSEVMGEEGSIRTPESPKPSRSVGPGGPPPLDSASDDESGIEDEQEPEESEEALSSSEPPPKPRESYEW